MKINEIIIPYLSPYLGIYDEAFQRYQNKKYENVKPEYALTALWINFQNSMSLIHHMTMMVKSFVIYLSIPDKLKKENEAYKGKSCGPGGIQFMYGEGPRNCYYDVILSRGRRYVYLSCVVKTLGSPFNSDCVRVSVSGNVHDSAPLSQVRIKVC